MPPAVRPLLLRVGHGILIMQSTFSVGCVQEGLLLRGGHGILIMQSTFSAGCVQEGETGFDESA